MLNVPVRSFTNVPFHFVPARCHVHLHVPFHFHLFQPDVTFVCSRSFSFVPFRCNVRLLTQYVTFVYSRSFTLVLSIRKERYSDQRFESHVRLQKPVTITRSFANVNLHTCSRDRTITLVYYLQKSSSQQ